jgi:hypothetical protein
MILQPCMDAYVAVPYPSLVYGHELAEVLSLGLALTGSSFGDPATGRPETVVSGGRMLRWRNLLRNDEDRVCAM